VGGVVVFRRGCTFSRSLLSGFISSHNFVTLCSGACYFQKFMLLLVNVNVVKILQYLHPYSKIIHMMLTGCAVFFYGTEVKVCLQAYICSAPPGQHLSPVSVA